MPAEEIAHLPALIRLAEQSLEAADLKGFAVAIAPFIEWADLCGLVNLPTDPDERETQVARIVRMYFGTTGHLPPDILHDALQAVMQRYDWRNLPNPAAINAAASDELERRRRILRRATTAAQHARRREAEGTRRPKPTPEEIAQVEAATASIKAIPWAPIGKHGPEIKRRVETAPYTADDLAAARKALAQAPARPRIAGYRPPHERGAE